MGALLQPDIEWLALLFRPMILAATLWSVGTPLGNGEIDRIVVEHGSVTFTY
jgi:hypothetical protein